MKAIFRNANERKACDTCVATAEAVKKSRENKTDGITIGDVVGGRQMTLEECIEMGELMEKMSHASDKGEILLAKMLESEINRRIEIYQQRTPW